VTAVESSARDRVIDIWAEFADRPSVAADLENVVLTADVAIENYALANLDIAVADLNPGLDEVWRNAALDAAKGTPLAPKGRAGRRTGPRSARRRKASNLVSIVGAIGEGDLAAERVGRAIDAAPGPDIVVRINSEGGSFLDAVEIGTAIGRKRKAGARITAHITGQAASAAANIAICCSEIVIAPAGRMMVHDVTVAARPTTAESRALDQMNATMATAFARFSGKGTPDQWRQVMARETWFTATEAVEAGLATRVGVRP